MSDPQVVVVPDPADAESERVQGLFTALDLPELLGRYFMMIWDTR